MPDDAPVRGLPRPCCGKCECCDCHDENDEESSNEAFEEMLAALTAIVHGVFGDNVALHITLKQQEIEQDFYENIIGLKCRYAFVESIEEARLLISINRGFMPIEYAENPDKENIIPLYHDDQPILRNYCAFWKKSETNYYIEEFADILRKTMRQHHHE